MIIETLGEAFKHLHLAGDLSGEQKTSVGRDVSAGNIGFDATGLGVIRRLTSEFVFDTLCIHAEMLLLHYLLLYSTSYTAFRASFQPHNEDIRVRDRKSKVRQYLPRGFNIGPQKA